MKIHEAIKMQAVFPSGRNARTEDVKLWAAARTARKRARQAIRRVGGVA